MTTQPDAVNANYRFYKDFAADYERTEPSVFGPRQQEVFRAALYRAVAHLRRDPSVLDACGGSGNVGMALTTKGITPVLVDVSPEMAEIWRVRAQTCQARPEIHIEPIEEFLHRDDRLWDMITFSSALHHLEDYNAVLNLAARRLKPGGLIFTMFDPTHATRGVGKLRKLDWRLHMLLVDPRRFWRIARNALSRGSPSEDPDAYVGRIAERHAIEGIDDFALRARLEGSGLTIVEHHRYAEARLLPIRAFLRLARTPTQFHLLVQNPAGVV